MNFRITLISFFILSLMLLSCTPKTPTKTTEVKVETPPPPPPVNQEDLSPCKKFADSKNMEGAKTAHVLYRDFLKQKQYKEAFPYWEKAYQMAPAADGIRDYHFLDGVKLYENLLSGESEQNKKDEYIKKILGFYDEASICYPKKSSLYKGLKAFKLYYSFPNVVTDKEKYELFKQVLDKDGEKTADFIINPFTALMVDLFISGEISMKEARENAKKILAAIKYGTENCKNSKDCDRWNIVKSYAPARLESLEGVEGFYDCAYYKDKYYLEYEQNPTDCETIAAVYGRLKWGKCSESDPTLLKLKPEMARCFPPSPTPTAAPLCSDMYRNGDYAGALACYEEKASVSSDSDKISQYYLTMAKIYYGHLKKFSKARKYARMALDARPGWGEPRVLIGKLYASSGPLCGPGTGFDSQVVTWVAIDEWNKAKKDPESRNDAQKLINKYTQYMPSKEDLFQRTLKIGDSFKVKCWIQQSTVIRAAP